MNVKGVSCFSRAKKFSSNFRYSGGKRIYETLALYRLQGLPEITHTQTSLAGTQLISMALYLDLDAGDSQGTSELVGEEAGVDEYPNDSFVVDGDEGDNDSDDILRRGYDRSLDLAKDAALFDYVQCLEDQGSDNDAPLAEVPPSASPLPLLVLCVTYHTQVTSPTCGTLCQVPAAATLGGKCGGIEGDTGGGSGKEKVDSDSDSDDIILTRLPRSRATSKRRACVLHDGDEVEQMSPVVNKFSATAKIGMKARSKARKKLGKLEKIMLKRQQAIIDLTAGHWAKYADRHVLKSWRIVDPKLIPNVPDSYLCDRNCARCKLTLEGH
jgi:hypothetical protein